VRFALVHVGDEPVAEGAAAVVADQRPLVGGLRLAQRVCLREDRAELVAEEALAGEPRDQWTETAAQSLLRRCRAGRFQHHAAVEEHDPGNLHLQPALEVARHQLIGDRGPHVVGDDEDGSTVTVAAHQLLAQVGLPEEAVVVLARLVGKAKAEEVEGEPVGRQLLLQQQPPVI
jgi:hypothetical protein